MTEHELPLADRLLLTMHNIGAIHERSARSIDELASVTGMAPDLLDRILEDHKKVGYVSVSGIGSSAKFFLTGRGIIRVSSMYT